MALCHKRDADARRKPRAALVAGPLAVLATASALTVGVLVTSPETDTSLADRASAAAPAAAAAAVDHRSREVASRGSSRMSARLERHMDRNADRVAEQAATLRAVRHAHVKRWTTTLLNLWTGPGKHATRVGLLAAGEHVLVTGRHDAGRVELALDGRSRWVTSGYLAVAKPVRKKPAEDAASSTSSRSSSSSSSSSAARAAAPAGLSSAPCPDSSVENGLTSGAVRLYRAVCHAFPQITSYGGWDAHGEHASGKALDVMTTDKGLGDSIAAYLQAHAGELGLYDIIWWDRIWTPVRASEGWRPYGDHGSATANHMDHVHVSVN